MRSLPPGQPRRAGTGPADPAPPPAEYGAAVDRYLAGAALGPASRRVYRISLTGWTWPLVGEPVPQGARPAPPLVPLAVLDEPGTAGRLAAALAARSAAAGPRTVSRELSALRSAVAWWHRQGWIRTGPASLLPGKDQPPGAPHSPGAGQSPGATRQPDAGHPPGAPWRAGPLPARPALSQAQAARLLRASPGLREHALWRVLLDTGAPAPAVLALDIGRLDLSRHRARLATGGYLLWTPATTELLRWLTAGRADGPVFLSGRRAPAGTSPAHTCPVTGRARLSYRRAAEIFTEVTRDLDPAGRGWTLHQLRRARSYPKKTSASA